MSMLEKLTEGIRQRSLAQEGEVITQKWEATGLLEGLDNDVSKNNMARLLENQAAQLLKEESKMSGQDVEGFASVAFPIVRRVFGGLLAQDLVSVQPMSLPSGLIFFMDFTYAPQTGALAGAAANESIYGGGVVASQVTGGVSLEGVPAAGTAAASDLGFRNLNTGYAHASASVDSVEVTVVEERDTYDSLPDAHKRNLGHDPDLKAANPQTVLVKVALTVLPDLNRDALSAITVSASGDKSLIGAGAEQIDDGGLLVRRATFISGSDLYLLFASATASELGDGSIDGTNADKLKIHYPVADNFKNGGAIGSVSGDSTTPAWPLESQGSMSEIDIKVDSVAVTAMTKKLKAHWSPELAQDLNAYHNLDAEVELTSVLSEMIAKEIDNEILKDLVEGANAATYYWSRKPGRFLQLDDGSATNPVADFTGNVSEWNETLLDTVNAVSAVIHRKTLRGGANFIVCSPEVAGILEFTSGFRASVENDADKGSWGAVKAGSISGKMDIFVDAGFPRNVLLVGRRGSSFLESGYVYAPYVPLQMTPTVLGVDDFTPRKGVMTRYAKKMVRSDMYGLVICRDFLLA